MNLTLLLICIGFTLPVHETAMTDPEPSATGANGSDTIIWYDAAQFKILGQAWDDLKDRYDRLPAKAEQSVRAPLWKLSTNSAGLAICFASNSSAISIKWTVRYDNELPHMAATGVKGVDLYAWHEGKWQFINNGRPAGKENEAHLISGMISGWREYLLYLPLYDGVDTLTIGIDKDSEISLPTEGRFRGKPIVFYGTSITQGGCATRPGMAYTSIISRKMNREVINLGFSGNGRMETELADLINEIDATCFVIDCLPNLSPNQVAERTVPFVLKIRSKHPSVPILLVESALPEKAFFDPKDRARVEAKNKNLFQAFEQLQVEGVEGLFYIPSEKLLGYDHDATVDGVHYTDLGFLRYADRLIKYLEGILE
jgi:hypothetical protein